MQEIEKIEYFLEKNGIKATQTQLNQFYRYYQLLNEYNKVMNLTSITDLEDVAVKHFADCTLNHSYYKQNSTILDIGTGAGFPGIPLKILRPDLKITLVDSLQKRVNFLNIVIKELNLQDISTIHSRAQELTEHNINKESFDYTTSRAVASLNILAEYCLPYIKIGGEMIALKSISAKDELSKSITALNILGGELKQIQQFLLTTQTEEVLQRNIIIIEKISQTPKQYPRPRNKIEQKPL